MLEEKILRKEGALGSEGGSTIPREEVSHLDLTIGLIIGP